jgi:hypothetical protein
MRKPMRNLGHDIWCPGGDSNRSSREYKSYNVNAEPTCSVSIIDLLRLIWQLSVAQITYQRMGKQWTVNWKGCGRRLLCSKLGHNPGTGMDGLRETPVRIICLLAKNRTRNLSHKIQKRGNLNQLSLCLAQAVRLLTYTRGSPFPISVKYPYSAFSWLINVKVNLSL